MKPNLALVRKILLHLYRRNYWGAKHTSVENAMKGIPTHLIGNAKHAMDYLVKENLVLPKPTHYGLQISLNPKKKDEIEGVLSSH